MLDIGGGSTELILGQGPKPSALESLHLGCVSMTERFFPDGHLTREAFDAARVAARLELRPVKAFFRDAADVEAIGTSGTILSTERVANALGVVESGLTFDAVEELIERVIRFDSIDALRMRGLSERRSQVWPGGLSILVELIGVLRIDKLNVSDGALREGLLYDLLGRMQHEDARERTCVPWPPDTTWIVRRQTVLRRPPVPCSSSVRRIGSCHCRWRNRYWFGPRNCTRLASTYRMTVTSVTVLTSPRMPTCLGFPARNNASSPS